MTPRTYATLEEWIASDALPFALDAPEAFDAAVDCMVAGLGSGVAVLGLGEALHGGVDMLRLRNQLFERLATAHGYSAIAVESSFPRGRLVNDYVAGRGPDSYEAVAERGFSHNFGRLAANRALVEWMKAYNADAAHPRALHFYGFDSPTEMWGSDSPRQLLAGALDGLAAHDGPRADAYRRRIEPLLGQDAAWENPAAMMDPAQSIGGSAAATALRLETEALLTDLRLVRPALTAPGDGGRLAEAERWAELARQLLSYHAAVAQPAADRTARLLGQRDLMMADNLAFIAAHERAQGGGRVLAFAHNSHVQRGEAAWQLGPDHLRWWPAGAHLAARLGAGYAVIGSAVGQAAGIGLGQPEAGTLEARLTAGPGPGRFVPTHRAQGLPAEALAAAPERVNHTANSGAGYFALTPRSLADFDWLAVLDETPCER